MAHFFIAVGGSGQDAALCYLRLARLCEFEPAPVWIIDADRIGETSQQFAILGLREQRGVYFVDPFPVLGGNQKLFRDLLDDSPEARKVLGVLFTPDQADVPIRQGMYGRLSAMVPARSTYTRG